MVTSVGTASDCKDLNEPRRRTDLRKVLIMGLPGAGKTTLAKALVPRLGAVHFNADDVRREINRDLGFSPADRTEQARRMGWLCDRVVEAGGTAVADFICPTPETLAAFGAGGDAFVVWLDRISTSRYGDTNRLFVPPRRCDVRVTADGTPEHWAEQVARRIRPVFDPKRPTALFVGRYQPFHNGHKALVLEGLLRVGQACIAVRNAAGTGAESPFGFEHVRSRIEGALRGHEGRFAVIQAPNITHLFYGRDAGYAVERIELDASVDAVAAAAMPCPGAAAAGMVG